MTEQRRIVGISGSDRVKFLQGLVTNNVQEGQTGLVYTALLTPQGKYLADFFLLQQQDRILLDAPQTLALDLIKRLTLYRLRADVVFEDVALHVHLGGAAGPARSPGDTAPADALADPRDPALGWRAYRDHPQDGEDTDRDALRVSHMIPEAGRELIAGESYILEMGFERLNGVDFRKGCYVGQEVTARMKHKTTLRKGLARVALDGPAREGTVIGRDGKPVGRLHTIAGDRALAYLRLDRAGPGMTAGEAQIRLIE